MRLLATCEVLHEATVVDLPWTLGCPFLEIGLEDVMILTFMHR